MRQTKQTNTLQRELINIDIIYSGKKLKLGLFFSELCFILTCSNKFNSGDVVTEKKPFWAPLYYLLINYIPEKVGISRIFVISWVFWVCINDK